MLLEKLGSAKEKIYEIHRLPQQGMLHQGLKLKKFNNFMNFKSVVSKLCRVTLQVIEHHRDASKLRTEIEMNSKNLF